MGVKTTFGMGWWDPDALVKLCLQNITLPNIFFRLVWVGQVGQGWSGLVRLVRVGQVGRVGVG